MVGHASSLPPVPSSSAFFLAVHQPGLNLLILSVPSGAMLRQSQARINIHRSKRLTGIAKKKDDICKHLEAGNEVNAKIWTETLINEEGMVPVYDVVSTMCD